MHPGRCSIPLIVRAFRRLRPRITYADVMATLAMFIALGGGAYAVRSRATPSAPHS